ncbi:ribonuclease H-like domain-containing protein [Tanacetum coccineum]|uniref:Ribonuclease H-like domain-containing protein n=1 Tax=Tanacetum coccineum TaxID=301880 RepID=A0ABQ5G0U1_9ASTR
MEKLVIGENKQRVLVRKRIERIGENKNRKRAVWNKNRQTDLVRKRIERSGELKNRKRVKHIENRQSVWNGIEVNVVMHKLNYAVQLHALVDGKKIIITESTVRRDLQLEDAEGVDCLPNATIFEQLTLMGYEKISQNLTFYKAFFSPQWKFLIHTILQCLSSKTTAWNEFSNTMESAIICLATNQKFNFSKYIFKSMVKNLDNVVNFLMYPRFIQVFLDKQLEGMPIGNRIHIAPSHTKKIFGNMRRVGKGFSGREAPLFQTMVVQAQAEIEESSSNPIDPHHTPTIIQPSTYQPQKKQRPGKPKRNDTEIPQSSGPIDIVADEAVNEEMNDSLEKAATTATSLDAEQDRGNINKTQSKATPNKAGSQGTTSDGNTLRSGEDRLKLEELMALCKNLQQRVLGLETTKTTQANEIASLKRRVNKLERRNKSITHGIKRMYRVGSSRRVESSEDEGLGEEDASKQGKIADIDANKDIYLVNVHTNEDMFGVNDLDGNEVIVDNVDIVKTVVETRSVVEEVTDVVEKAKLVSAVEETVNAAATTVSTASTIPVSAATTTTTTTATITDVEVTLAQALAELKSAKPKAVKVVIQEPEQEEERLAREKAQQTEEASIAWDDVQAKIEADYQLAQRLQAQEQEELTTEENASLFGRIVGIERLLDDLRVTAAKLMLLVYKLLLLVLKVNAVSTKVTPAQRLRLLKEFLLTNEAVNTAHGVSAVSTQRSGIEVLIMHIMAYTSQVLILRFTDIQVGEITIEELMKKLEIVQKEKDGIQFNVDKIENASKSLNNIIESQIVDNCKKGLGYNAVPPPLTGNFMPPKPDLSFTGLEEFISEHVVLKPVIENSEAKAVEVKPKAVRKNNGAPIIEDWVSDSEEEDLIVIIKGGKNLFEQNATKGESSNFAKKNSQPRPKKQAKSIMDYRLRSDRLWISKALTGNQFYLQTYEEIMEDMLLLEGTPKEGKSQENVPLKLMRLVGILNPFITGIENLVDHKVKVIRCDNGTEFKNKVMNQFCDMKGILRQYSVARTPQQNGVAERRNRTLIEAVRTMLADSKLPTTFWAEAVNTACHLQNRVLVVKPHNKTPYELFHGKTPTLSFMRPFGCPVTILNTIDHSSKFDGKADEGFFVGYSSNSKAFRVLNSRTRIVEENLHIRFSENTPNVVGSGPDWLFDTDALTRTINYEPIVAGTQSNSFISTKASDNAGQARKEIELVKNYILLPLWLVDPPFSQDPRSSQDDGSKPSFDDEKKVDEDP